MSFPSLTAARTARDRAYEACLTYMAQGELGDVENCHYLDSICRAEGDYIALLEEIAKECLLIWDGEGFPPGPSFAELGRAVSFIAAEERREIDQLKAEPKGVTP